MTLLEVLAATVLLSLIVGTCLPMLAPGVAETSGSPTPQVHDLAWAADEIMKDPESFGLRRESLQELYEPVVVKVNSALGSIEVCVHAVRAAGPGPQGHTWIVCESGGVAVSRWFVRPEGAATP